MIKIFFVYFLIFFKSSISSGQVFDGNTTKYENGNSLIITDSILLKDKNNNTIEIWDNLADEVFIKSKRYFIISKTRGEKKVGLFDAKKGLIVIPISYDFLRPMESGNGVVLSKVGKKLGLINVELLVSIPAVYEMLFYYRNGNYLLKKENKAFEIDSKLKILDSISGFKDFQYINYKMNKRYSVVYTLSGTYIFDNENILIVQDKKWTKIHNEFSGDNLIISTKVGYGLYNIKTKNIIEPYVNRYFETKPFYNEQILFAEQKKWKLFDSTGKKLMEVMADSIVPAIDGEWSGFFYKEKSLWGFIDVNGRISLPTPRAGRHRTFRWRD